MVTAAAIGHRETGAPELQDDSRYDQESNRAEDILCPFGITGHILDREWK